MLYLKRILSWLAKLINRKPLGHSVYGALQSVYLARACHLAAELGIADLLKLRSMTCRELADVTNTHEDYLYRIMRALASAGIFEEQKEQRFAMNNQAEVLSRESISSLGNWICFVGREENWNAFGASLKCVQEGINGFQIAHGKSFYEYGVENHDYGNAFMQGMNSWTEWQCPTVVDAYDFRDVGKIVDVGGGHGRLMMEILKRNDRVQGILYDQPQVVESTYERLNTAGFERRCKAIAGNILESVPSGGNLYILKHVLRDWNDKDAGAILANCRSAMPADAILLVIDGIIDPTKKTDPLLALLDLEQMFWLRGAIRTRDEWATLFQRNGFSIRQIIPTSIVDMTIMEICIKPN